MDFAHHFRASLFKSAPARQCCLILLLVLPATYAFGQDTIRLFQYAGNLKQVKANIGGHDLRLLFDAGGGFTLVSPEVAGKIGKSPYGDRSGYRMSGEKISYQRIDSVDISFGKLSLFHAEMGVWDVMRVLPAGLPKLDGVLSLKSFEGRVVEMDLANDRLILHNTEPWSGKPSEWNEIRARFATGNEGSELTIFLHIPNNGRNYWFLFDSGNIGQLLVSENAAREWRLPVADSTAASREMYVDIQPFAKRTPFEIRKILYDGALNFDVISRYRFILDFPAGKVWYQVVR